MSFYIKDRTDPQNILHWLSHTFLSVLFLPRGPQSRVSLHRHYGNPFGPSVYSPLNEIHFVIWKAKTRNRESTVTKMREYSGEKMKVRLWKRKNTIMKIRLYYAFSSSYLDIFVIVFWRLLSSYFSDFTFWPSYAHAHRRIFFQVRATKASKGGHSFKGGCLDNNQIDYALKLNF